MRTFRNIRLAACTALLFGSAGPGLVLAAPPTEPATGQWQEHRYSFVFMGFTSIYSCDGLADKLKLLLIAAGARADAQAHPGACASGFGQPDKFARADLIFHTLAPADGTPPGSPDAAVRGTWRTVTLTEHHPQNLRTGDCELVDQFRAGVLPLFVIRDLQSNTRCIPHQESGSNIDAKFEVFAAVQQADLPKR